MRTHSSRFRITLGATALSLSTLVTGAGCGAGTATTVRNATPRSATAPFPGFATSPASSQAEVGRRLRDLERRHDGRVGAYAIDTGTGQVLGYRSGERFPTASTFKAMLSAAVLRKARMSDPALMDRVVRYTSGDVMAYAPITKDHVGTGMTVAELCDAAVTMSDNTAANLLLRQIGGPTGLTAFYRSIGDAVSRLDRWEPELNVWNPGEWRDTTTPSTFARDLWALTLGTALAPADRARLIGWMKKTKTGGARIRAGLPGWTVADKTGTAPTYGATNDIAVAWPPSGAPVIMVILTNRRAANGSTDDKAVAETAAILARGLGRAG